MKTLLKVELFVLACAIAATASAQSFWPFIPNHERPREVPRQNEVCIYKPFLDQPVLAIVGEFRPLVKTCFLVDPATNVPQPTPAQKLLRRM